MRIGLDVQCTQGQVTGIGAYAQGLAAALAAVDGGHTFVPLAFPGFRLWPAPAEMMRVQVGLVAASWRRRLDVIHSPGFASPVWGRTPRLLSLHDLSVWQRPELLPAGPSRWYWRDFMPIAARRAACLIVPSRFSAEVTERELRIPAERIRQVPYPPRVMFRPASAERQAALRRQFGLRRPYVLGVGALEPRKDWGGVVRAFGLMAAHCGHDLVLAGSTNVQASAAALHAEIFRLGLCGRVRHLGYVAAEWLAPLYTAAAVFVFPETYAGYGLPLLEAMACGTPVVSYANTALPETAGGAAVLIPPPYDPAEIARALLAILHDAALGNALRRRGAARVAELDWAQTARAMTAIYEEFGRC